jgi:Rad3-related DNA helicase
MVCPKGNAPLAPADALPRPDGQGRCRFFLPVEGQAAVRCYGGVDVPGESLSNVIITKLPFAVPSHPLAQARSEKIKRMGGNAFFDYSLPEAVLKFRQGVGRLIRSRSDNGMVVILDSRVVSKRYGRTFLNSIPPYPRNE